MAKEKAFTCEQKQKASEGRELHITHYDHASGPYVELMCRRKHTKEDVLKIPPAWKLHCSNVHLWIHSYSGRKVENPVHLKVPRMSTLGVRNVTFSQHSHSSIVSLETMQPSLVRTWILIIGCPNIADISWIMPVAQQWALSAYLFCGKKFKLFPPMLEIWRFPAL